MALLSQTLADVPNTFGGKAFTIVYVPFSVVMVASAIQHVASVPLKNRAVALEDYVLSQFGKRLKAYVSSILSDALGHHMDTFPPHLPSSMLGGAFHGVARAI